MSVGRDNIRSTVEKLMVAMSTRFVIWVEEFYEPRWHEADLRNELARIKDIPLHREYAELINDCLQKIRTCRRCGQMVSAGNFVVLLLSAKDAGHVEVAACSSCCRHDLEGVLRYLKSLPGEIEFMWDEHGIFESFAEFAGNMRQYWGSH